MPTATSLASELRIAFLLVGGEVRQELVELEDEADGAVADRSQRRRLEQELLRRAAAARLRAILAALLSDPALLMPATAKTVR